MKRIAPFTATITAFLLLLVARPSFADPIDVTITSGVLDMKGTGPGGFGSISLVGTDGFSLVAGVDVESGVFAPADCAARPCAPGSPISLDARWEGNDLASTVTLAGVTYKDVGSFSQNTSARVNFAGLATSPPLNGATTAFIQAPFTFTGSFADYPGGPSALLTGKGTASLWLTLDTSFGSGVTSWDPSEVRYDFAVTPEPSSLLLLATGLAGALGLARRRLSGGRTGE